MRSVLFAVALLLCLAGCSSTSALVPDHVYLFYIEGDALSNFDKRDVDFETHSHALAGGLSWAIGAKSQTDPETERRYSALLDRLDSVSRSPESAPTKSETAPPSAPPSDAEHDTEKGETKPTSTVAIGDFVGNAKEYLYYAAGLLLAAVAAILKRQKIREGYHRIRHGKKTPPTPPLSAPPSPSHHPFRGE